MPHWHPIIVHFPIALLTASVLVDLAAIVTRRERWHTSAYVLLVAGVVGAAAAVLSGNSAADTHRQTAVAELLETHEDLATGTRIGFVVTTLGRLPLALRHRAGWPLFAWIALAVAGCVLLWMTSLHGGELVYIHGVGVSADPPP